MLKNFNLGLREKLVVIVVAGIVVGFMLLGAFRIYNAKQSINEEIDRSGNERITLIAEALSNLIVGYDYSNMEFLAERIVKLQDVQQITIRNQAGKIMVTRKSSNFNQALNALDYESPVLFSGKPVGSVALRISLERYEQSIRRTSMNIFLLFAVFAIFLGVLLYVVTSKAIIQPIGHFRDLMKEILNDPSGRVRPKLEIASQDEIGELAAIFNTMNDKVHDYQQRLQEKYILADSNLLATNEQLKARTKQLEIALAQVEQLATTDSLTQLPNRRHFDTFLATATPRVLRFNESVCLLVIDVDNFKQINDQHGHGVGDYVLQELARLFKSRTRETDICARMGGDEFALLLCHADKDEALALSQDLLHKVSEHSFVAKGQKLLVMLSIGIAQLEAEIHDTEMLYGAADTALYEAKRRGRGQVVVYPFA
ncbi:MAG: diguanylate cyclase [Pseudomonadota bacterium]